MTFICFYGAVMTFMFSYITVNDREWIHCFFHGGQPGSTWNLISNFPPNTFGRGNGRNVIREIFLYPVTKLLSRPLIGYQLVHDSADIRCYLENRGVGTRIIALDFWVEGSIILETSKISFRVNGLEKVALFGET